MGAIVGLGVGVGLLLIFLAYTGGGPERRRRAVGLVDSMRSSTRQASPPVPNRSRGAKGRVGDGGVYGHRDRDGGAGIALLAGLAAASVPVLLLRRRVNQQIKARQESWPDAVDQLTSAIRAGLSLPEAVADLARRGPEPLRMSFAEFDAEYRVRGSFPDALRRFIIGGPGRRSRMCVVAYRATLAAAISANVPCGHQRSAPGGLANA